MSSSVSQRFLATLGMTILLALGWLVRLYNLSAQSLWNDEGTSVALARLSLPAIISGAAHDIHPPLYYLFLHFWMSVAGESEFAVRALSAAAGLTLIAVTARLARDLFGNRVALLAAALSALSAFQLYYSQETRMYIWAALWSALSVWALVRFLRAASLTRIALLPLAGWISASIAALYTHYFAPTILLAEGIATVIWFLIEWKRGALAVPRMRYGTATWLTAGAVLISLAFVPWLAYAGNQLSSWPAISDRFSLPDLTWRVLGAFVLGIDTPRGDQTWIVLVFGTLFVWGVAPVLDGGRRTEDGRRKTSIPASVLRPPSSVVLLALWALVPLLFMYAVSFQRPAYNPKFLLLATPGFLILVARGLAHFLSFIPVQSKGRWRTAWALPFWSMFALLFTGAWLALQGVYADPRLQRDDYRGVIDYINRNARGIDAVLVDAPGQMDVVRYYYRGSAPVFALPVGRPMVRGATDEQVRQMTSRPGNVYAIYWATEQADPERFIEQSLAMISYQAADEWHGNIRLAIYGNLDSTAGKKFLIDSPVRFGDEILLRGAMRFGREPFSPGRVVQFQFQWEAIQQPSTNCKVFVHLLNQAGEVVGQRDVEPVGGFRPTTSWHTGEWVTDDIGLLIQPGTPPGNYTVEMGVYRADTGQRLPLSTGGDHLILGEVQVVAGQ